MQGTEVRFRALVEELPDVIVLFNPKITFEYVSSAATRILGFSPEELLGQNGLALVHPDDQERVKAEFAELISNPSKNRLFEHRFRHKDESWRHLEVTAVNRLADPAVGAVIGHFRDVSERSAREEALRRAEEKYRSIFENAIEGIFQTTRDGQFLAVNPALAKMLGYDSPEEFTREVKSTAGKLHTSPARRAEITHLLADLGKVSGYACELVCKDGSIIQTAVNARALYDNAGEVLYYEGTVEDVTERKRLEDQYRQAQKMEAVGRLAGGVAHDFNNLLTVIMGYGDLCVASMRPQDPLHELVTEMLKAGERASNLTRQLLAFSRKQVLNPVVLDLNTVIDGMETMLRRLIGEDVAMSFHRDAHLWFTKADPGQIEQVVMNIVINARDAMPLGGKLLLETKNVVLDEGYVQTHTQAQLGEHVLLAISDTGCGIDPSIKPRIFEPFFTTKGPAKGTGLGLATVYGIVKQSGGHIDVYSEPGQGTTFKIYLPRDLAGAPASPAVRAQGNVRGGTETILLVEDEQGVRSLARTVLQKLGYTILEARHGDEALMLCRAHSAPISLLVSDVIMPNMSGPQLQERLAGLKPKIKVLYMSGYTEDAIVHHGVLDTGIPFVQKPFAPETLARAVREALDR